jgi:hypothetical protein
MRSPATDKKPNPHSATGELSSLYQPPPARHHPTAADRKRFDALASRRMTALAPKQVSDGNNEPAPSFDRDDDERSKPAERLSDGEQEVRAHARVETCFRFPRGIRRAPSRLLVSPFQQRA